MALAWLLAQPAVASIVIGAKTISQLEDNMKGAHLTLSPDQVGVACETSSGRAIPVMLLIIGLDFPSE